MADKTRVSIEHIEIIIPHSDFVPAIFHLTPKENLIAPHRTLMHYTRLGRLF